MKKYAWGDNAHKREACAIAWREYHPGQPDPDDETLHAWLVAWTWKREDALHWWRLKHPGRPDPGYPELYRWYSEAHDQCLAGLELNMMEERGEKPS